MALKSIHSVDVKHTQRLDKLTGRFEVVTVSPLTVYLDGYTDVAVPANGIKGMTYVVGETGIYVKQGRLPTCWVTV